MSAIDTCRKNLDKHDAPEGFYAVLSFDVVTTGVNACDQCDYTSCKGDECSQRKRKDGCEVVFLAKKG